MASGGRCYLWKWYGDNAVIGYKWTWENKEYENENLENCYSNLCVSIIKGEEIEHREIKEYKWITLNEYKESGIKAYIPILEKICNDYNN